MRLSTFTLIRVNTGCYMKWNIQFDADNKFVRANQSGEFSLAEEASFFRDIFASKYWLYGMPLMIDYCRLVVTGIHSREVDSTSDLMIDLKESIGPGKIALLCNGDEQYGLGRQFQMTAEIQFDREIRVFHEEAVAIQWLIAELASAQ